MVSVVLILAVVGAVFLRVLFPALRGLFLVLDVVYSLSDFLGVDSRIFIILF